jgi:hypothetical protein
MGKWRKYRPHAFAACIAGAGVGTLILGFFDTEAGLLDQGLGLVNSVLIMFLGTITFLAEYEDQSNSE